MIHARVHTNHFLVLGLVTLKRQFAFNAFLCVRMVVCCRAKEVLGEHHEADNAQHGRSGKVALGIAAHVTLCEVKGEVCVSEGVMLAQIARLHSTNQIMDIHAIARTGDLQALQACLAANPNAVRTTDGVRACVCCHTEVCAEICDRQDGRTALHTAASSGNEGVVRMLCEAGADVDSTDEVCQSIHVHALI
jgi:hypothetical protein